MSQAKAYRERIGDMLIVAGLVTPSQVDEALQAQRSSGMRLGRQLVALGHVSELQLAQILSNQLTIPWVSLERIEFSRELLARVPAELADRHALMPIYVRSVRDQGDTLYLAIEDPTDEAALQLASQKSGLPVRAMIAAPTDIRRAIERHYFAESHAPQASGEGLREVLQRAAESLYPPAPGEAPRARAPAPPVPVNVVKAPGSAKRADVAPSPTQVGEVQPPQTFPAEGGDGAGDDVIVPLAEYETPSQPPVRGRRTLTLLDGTEVALPASRAKRFSQEITQVRQVVRVIRAASADAGVETAPTWHEVVDILLHALSAKGVRLTRKELAEAYVRVAERRSPK